ncbi:hypothetical protein ALT_6870 [Aspergillus lentulus]|uniref:Uncharacterized protein n=1 Tax=Aspergillus lentulus TaxID=293939 RepID=A0AAN4TCN1_ASPLE|nr:hypothetical protein ALT_6870 [Aspergillus lentulus]
MHATESIFFHEFSGWESLRWLPSPPKRITLQPSNPFPMMSGALLGKRRREQIEASPTPSVKRKKKHPLDGIVLAWPLSISDFEDLEHLRLVRGDLVRFSAVVNNKIAKLEESLRPVEEEEEDDLDPKDKAYWDEQLANLDDL